MKRHTPLCAAIVAVSLVVVAGSLAALLAAEQYSAPTPPVFRSGVDVVLLDVTALDRNRRPARGLKAEDFTVLVDGVARPIVSFQAADLRAPAAPTAAWMRDVPRDIVTNTEPSSRLVVILIDDGSQEETGDLWSVQKTREVAKAVVDGLGPDDLASVLFTNSTRSSQAFTRDRVRLRTAIDKAAMFPAPSPGPGATQSVRDEPVYTRGDCYCGLCSIDAIGSVAEALRQAPEPHKVIVYVSVGLIVISPAQAESSVELNCQLRKQESLGRSFRAAQVANVTVHTIDPKGLVVGGASSSTRLSNRALRVESLRMLAENTGGRAIVNSNDMERQVPALLDETSSFYQIGIDAGAPAKEGSYRAVSVRVNRPDVDVRTRKGLYAMTTKEREAAEASERSPSTALASPFSKADMPLDVAAVPFLEPGPGRRPTVAVVLNVHPDPSDDGDSSEWFTATSAALVPQSGRMAGEGQQILNVQWPPRSDGTDASFEVLSRMPVAPGRYELRLGMESDTGRSGTVHTFVEVPDFSGEAVSLSGLVLLSSASPMVAPPDAFSDILPRPFTARRVFDEASPATVFLRVYQATGRTPSLATVRLRLVDEQNVQRAVHEARLEPAAFETSRSADFSYDLPLASLSRGEYLVSVDVRAGDKSLQRTLRFHRR
jgi:VWFA-related protein